MKYNVDLHIENGFKIFVLIILQDVEINNVN